MAAAEGAQRPSSGSGIGSSKGRDQPLIAVARQVWVCPKVLALRVQVVKGGVEVVLYLLGLSLLTVVHREWFNPELERPSAAILAKYADADYIGVRAFRLDQLDFRSGIMACIHRPVTLSPGRLSLSGWRSLAATSYRRLARSAFCKRTQCHSGFCRALQSRERRGPPPLCARRRVPSRSSTQRPSPPLGASFRRTPLSRNGRGPSISCGSVCSNRLSSQVPRIASQRSVSI